MKKRTAYLGIDVSKNTLDCALRIEGQSSWATWKSANSPEGYAAIVKRLGQSGLVLASIHAILEATGIYSQPVHEALHRAGIKTSCVNPRQVKDFGRSFNLRAKNDRIDARLLAGYGAERHPPVHLPPSPDHKRLRAWVNELDALVEERRRLLNRMESTLDRLVSASQKATLRSLDRRIESIERSIGALIDNNPILAQQARLMVTIPGIAMRTAARVLAQIADKQFESARSLAAYAGLTPSQHQSGTSINKPARLSKIGNARLRRALYMSAGVARRYCRPLAQWADSLLQRGKTKSAVRGALMRKLLHLIFGVLKNNEPFDSKKAAFSYSFP